MKKLTMLAIALMLSGSLTTVALGASQAQATNPTKVKAKTNAQIENKKAQKIGLKKQKALMQKRDAAKARRDAALELRTQNILTNNPGNTGM